MAINMAEFKKKIGVLHELERVRNAIRQKHKLLKVGKIEAERSSSEKFKPIVQPLERFIDVAMVAPSSKKFVDNKALIKRELKMDNYEPMKQEYDYGGSSASSSASSSAKTIIDADNYESAADDTLPEEMKMEEQQVLPVSSYLQMLDAGEKDDLDTQVGVRIAFNKFMFGNQAIRFEENKVKVGDLVFDETPGLVKLLFLKSPTLDSITPEDEKNFADLVLSTDAHRTYYSPDGEFRSFNKKYLNFVRPFEQKRIDEEKQVRLRKKRRSQKGGGGMSYKIAKKHTGKMDYVYWDDPNELVNRLQLLFAESAAGNTNHVNEISAIVEELREAGIIY